MSNGPSLVPSLSTPVSVASVSVSAIASSEPTTSTSSSADSSLAPSVSPALSSEPTGTLPVSSGPLAVASASAQSSTVPSTPTSSTLAASESMSSSSALPSNPSVSVSTSSEPGTSPSIPGESVAVVSGSESSILSQSAQPTEQASPILNSIGPGLVASTTPVPTQSGAPSLEVQPSTGLPFPSNGSLTPGAESASASLAQSTGFNTESVFPAVSFSESPPQPSALSSISIDLPVQPSVTQPSILPSVTQTAGSVPSSSDVGPATESPSLPLTSVGESPVPSVAPSISEPSPAIGSPVPTLTPSIANPTLGQSEKVSPEVSPTSVTVTASIGPTVIPSPQASSSSPSLSPALSSSLGVALTTPTEQPSAASVEPNPSTSQPSSSRTPNESSVGTSEASPSSSSESGIFENQVTLPSFSFSAGPALIAPSPSLGSIGGSPSSNLSSSPSVAVENPVNTPSNQAQPSSEVQSPLASPLESSAVTSNATELSNPGTASISVEPSVSTIPSPISTFSNSVGPSVSSVQTPSDGLGVSAPGSTEPSATIATQSVAVSLVPSGTGPSASAIGSVNVSPTISSNGLEPSISSGPSSNVSPQNTVTGSVSPSELTPSSGGSSSSPSSFTEEPTTSSNPTVSAFIPQPTGSLLPSISLQGTGLVTASITPISPSSGSGVGSNGPSISVSITPDVSDSPQAPQSSVIGTITPVTSGSVPGPSLSAQVQPSNAVLPSAITEPVTPSPPVTASDLITISPSVGPQSPAAQPSQSSGIVPSVSTTSNAPSQTGSGTSLDPGISPTVLTGPLQPTSSFAVSTFGPTPSVSVEVTTSPGSGQPSGSLSQVVSPSASNFVVTITPPVSGSTALISVTPELTTSSDVLTSVVSSQSVGALPSTPVTSSGTAVSPSASVVATQSSAPRPSIFDPSDRSPSTIAPESVPVSPVPSSTISSTVGPSASSIDSLSVSPLTSSNGTEPSPSISGSVTPDRIPSSTGEQANSPVLSVTEEPINPNQATVSTNIPELSVTVVPTPSLQGAGQVTGSITPILSPSTTVDGSNGSSVSGTVTPMVSASGQDPQASISAIISPSSSNTAPKSSASIQVSPSNTVPPSATSEPGINPNAANITTSIEPAISNSSLVQTPSISQASASISSNSSSPVQASPSNSVLPSAITEPPINPNLANVSSSAEPENSNSSTVQRPTVSQTEPAISPVTLASPAVASVSTSVSPSVSQSVSPQPSQPVQPSLISIPSIQSNVSATSGSSIPTGNDTSLEAVSPTASVPPSQLPLSSVSLSPAVSPSASASVGAVAPVIPPPADSISVGPESSTRPSVSTSTAAAPQSGRAVPSTTIPPAGTGVTSSTNVAASQSPSPTPSVPAPSSNVTNKSIDQPGIPTGDVSGSKPPDSVPPNPAGKSGEPEDGRTGSDTNQQRGFPGGTAAIIGIAVFVIIAFVVVSVGLYKASGSLPSGGILPFTWSDDSSSLDSLVIGDESPWDQVWRNASDPDITKEEREQAEEAAAAIGGQFAGLLKPGAEKVRPPQVITRSAAVDLTVALNRLASGEVSCSDMGSAVSSSGGSRGGGENLPSPSAGPSTAVAAAAVRASLPNMDLMVVLDASSSLQWRDYRRLKEALTGPGGLLDEVMSKTGSGSRVGLVEYAYDCLVVSELDSDQSRVRRRILGTFQGDMNNWDRESMFIYEVDEDYGGNVLRKVSSVREAHDAKRRRESTAHEPGAEEILWDIEQAPTVSAKEVPNSMNGISREVHVALKWARFELLPVAANPEVQALINATKRLRRVLVINAGELTKGGDPSYGISAAQNEVEDLKNAGVEVVTLGVGEHQDPNLVQLGTRSRHSHITARTVDDVQGMQPLLAAAVLHTPRPSPSAVFSSAVAAAMRKIRASKPKNGPGGQAPLPPVVRAGSVANEPLRGGVTKKRRSIFGRTKTRMPRGMSELSPWFNSTRKSNARQSFPSRRTTLRRFSSF